MAKYIYNSLHLPVRYPNFGIFIPSGYEIHGIDVSKHQGTINWNEVATMKDKSIQLKFVFMKATQGNYLTDKRYKKNWITAKEVGLIRGVYHYYDPRINSTQQANYFVSKVDLSEGDLAPVLDIEETRGYSKAKIQEGCLNWLRLVENHYGIRPIIYTNVDFYINYLGNTFDEYPLWIAHYYQPTQPRIKRDWQFWQHSDKGNVNGIEHLVDFNVFDGSINLLKDNYCIVN